MKLYALVGVVLVSSGCAFFQTKEVSSSESELVEELGAACETPFGSLPSGGSYVAYSEPHVLSGQSCVDETRVCINGELSGSYQFLSCFEGTMGDDSSETQSVVIPALDEN